MVNIKVTALLFLLLLGGLGAGVVVYLKSQPIPGDAAYIGSSECRECHSVEHAGWLSSLHPRMMRRVSASHAVVADLGDDSDVPFDPEEAVWVIGSKWEQQFMGRKNGQETLLPGAWLVGGKKWKQKGWDGWQVPNPLQRCHGCHTVGLNVESGEFVEPSIGCESCHGPGSWHVNSWGIGRIYSGLDAQACGQCHTRGKSTDGKHFFPVDYRPGEPLDKFFTEMAPSDGQNSSQWWGNGHARKRHQEYFAWKQGGHANSLKSIKDGYDGRYGEASSECLACHAGEAAVAGMKHGYSLNDVEQGITCGVCHNVHGDLDSQRIKCAACHRGGAFFHDQKANEKHVPCPDDAEVQCTSCHMPLTGMNGGAYTLHSHTPGIIPPGDTRSFQVPNSCANGGCHSDRSVDWLEAVYLQHYGRKSMVD